MTDNLLKTFVLGIIALAIMLSGCSSTSLSQDNNKGEITVWAWNTAADALEVSAQNFMKKYPGTKIKIEKISRDTLYDKLTVGLVTKEGLPDVVMVDERFTIFKTKYPDGFLDLTKLIEPYKNDFDSSKWTIVTNGKNVLAVPWDSAPTGLFYRRDLFAKAGVNPDTILTWDDFLTAGKKIKELTGYYLFPCDVSNEDAVLRMMLNQLGTFYFDQEGKIVIHQDKAVQALSMLKKAYDMGLVMDAPTWDAIVETTRKGYVAAIPSGVWYSGFLKSEAPNFKGQWGIMQLPAFTPRGNRAANFGGSNLAIPSTTKNIKLAWDFVKYCLITSEGQIAMMKSYGIFPSYKPCYEDSYFSNNDDYFGGQKVCNVFTKEVKDIKPVNYTEDFLVAQPFVINAQYDVLINNERPETALLKAAQLISKATGRKMQ